MRADGPVLGYDNAYNPVHFGTHGPRCATCGHTRWHHMGAREPGCTYLGTCRCCAFLDEALT